MRVILSAVAVTALLNAQAPSFDAASVRISVDKSESRRFSMDPGRITVTNTPLRECVRRAWNLKDYQIEGLTASGDPPSRREPSARQWLAAGSTSSTFLWSSSPKC